MHAAKRKRGNRRSRWIVPEELPPFRNLTSRAEIILERNKMADLKESVLHPNGGVGTQSG